MFQRRVGIAHQYQIPRVPLVLTIFRFPVENNCQPTINCYFSVGNAHPTSSKKGDSQKIAGFCSNLVFEKQHLCIHRIYRRGRFKPAPTQCVQNIVAIKIFQKTKLSRNSYVLEIQG